MASSPSRTSAAVHRGIIPGLLAMTMYMITIALMLFAQASCRPSATTGRALPV